MINKHSDAVEGTAGPAEKVKGRGGARVPANAASGKPALPTRKAQLVKLLSRKAGATVAQVQAAFGWQPHSVRAALSGLRKAGIPVARQDGAKGAVYRIVAEEAQQ